MGGLSVGAYIDELRTHGSRLLDAAASAGLDADVPSCDDWVVRELVRHIGGVHHWASRQLGEKRTDEITGELVDIVGGWPPDDELLTWAAAQHASAVAELTRADPSYPYFTWFRGDTPVTMWARRMAHETAIHRIDAELAAGWQPRFTPAFAADGIDELVLDMLGDGARNVPTDAVTTLQLVAEDANRSWTVTMSAAGFQTEGARRGDADATIRGSASAIYQALWGRSAVDLAIDGDGDALELWLATVRPAWA